MRGMFFVLSLSEPSTNYFLTRALLLILNHGLDQERRQIADWLSSLNFKASQLEFLSQQQHGSGEWMLNSPKFEDWRDGISKTLWCPGDREIVFLAYCVSFAF